MRKNIRVAALSIALLGALVSCGSKKKASSAVSDDTDKLVFEAVKDGYMVSSVLDTSVEALKIPAVYEGKNVVMISDDALKDCKSLRNVTLPDTITNISSSLFKSCPIAYNMYMGGSYLGSEKNPYMYMLKYDGDNAASLHSDTKLIGDFAFENSTITSIKFNASLNKISYRSFYNVDTLYSIELPESLKIISDDAFYECDNLYEVYNFSSLPIRMGSSDNGYAAYYAKVLNTTKTASVISYDGDYIYMTLEGKKSLIKYLGAEKKLTISGVDTIAKSAFASSNVEEIVISDDVKAIEDKAFDSCKQLKKLVIGDNVKTIGEEAFANCRLLTEVVVGERVSSVGNNAFYGDTQLNYVYYNNDTSSWAKIKFNSNVSDDIFSNPMKYAQRIFFKTETGYEQIIDLVLDETVTSIGTAQFMNFKDIESVTFKGSVSSIDAYAFMGCEKLEAFIIPAGVKSIESALFEGCTSLKDLYFGKDVKTVNNIFGSSEQVLENIHFDGDENDWNHLEFVDQYSAFGEYTNNIYFTKNEVEYIPSAISVTDNISNYAFSGFKTIKDVYLGSGLNRIGTHAFLNADSIEKVYFDDSETNWARITFTTLTSNPIHNGAKLFIADGTDYKECTFPRIDSNYILPYAFYNSNITNLIISKKVLTIGYASFAYCENLGNVYYEGNEDDWSRVQMQEGDLSVLHDKKRIYMYSETAPEGEGLFWHYSESGVPEGW